jgi:hypothetical protein
MAAELPGVSPRQKPGSFNLSQVMEKLSSQGGSN